MTNKEPFQISPKSLKKIAKRKYNMSYAWFTVVGIFGAVTVFLLMAFISYHGTLRLIITVIIMLLWGFFLWKLRNDELLENMKLTYHYYTRKNSGATLISKYNEAATRLLFQFLGIEGISNTGLIKYNGDIYFFILQYFPPRNCDDSKAEYNTSVQHMLKTFSDYNPVQFNMDSITKKSDRYSSVILSAANKEGVTAPVKEYLFSLQDMVAKKTREIEPEFHMMVGLGYQKNASDAEKSMETIFGGIEYQFKSLNVKYKLISTPQDITELLAKKLTKGF